MTLAKAGYEVALIAPHQSSESVDGVRICGLPKVEKRWLRRTRGLWQVYRAALRTDAGVYHFHDPELIPVGALLRLQTRARVIYDVHEYYSEVIPARAGLRKAFPFFRLLCHTFLEYLPARFFDALVFPTQALQQKFGPASRSETVQNLPSVEDRSVGNVWVDWEEKEYDVVFVGTISPFRVAFILEIVKNLVASGRRIKWLFVGMDKPAEQWLRIRLDSNLAQHFVIIGRVPHDEVLDYLRRSRIGFNHHTFERRFMVAIPNKVFEYMMMGLPVVTTALPELNRLIGNQGCALLIDSQDPDAYARAIERLLSDKTGAQSIGRAGHNLIHTRLNWQHSEAPKLLSAYAKLL